MSIRLTTQLSLAALVLAFAAGTSAMAATTTTTTTTTTKPAHHVHHGVGRAGVGHMPAATSKESAVDALNQQSLAAAQSGQTFTPTGTPTSAPPAAPMKHKKAM